jgi:hypothetical protein
MKKLIILPLLVCSLSSFAFAEEVELLNGETIILIEDEEDFVEEEEEDNEIYYIEDEEDLWEEDENNTIVPIEDEDEEDKLLSMIKKVIKALIIKGWELIVER